MSIAKDFVASMVTLEYERSVLNWATISGEIQK